MKSVKDPFKDAIFQMDCNISVFARNSLSTSMAMGLLAVIYQNISLPITIVKHFQTAQRGHLADLSISDLISISLLFFSIVVLLL